MALCHSDVNYMLSTDINIKENILLPVLVFGNQ